MATGRLLADTIMNTFIAKHPRFVSVIELIVFVTIAVGSKKLLDPIFWRYSGPVTLIGTLILLTIYMRFRGEGWADLGLKPLPGLRAKLMLIPQTGLTFLAFMASVAAAIYGGGALGIDMEAMPEGVEERWGDIKGNLAMLLLWLGIVWTAAAFGEEMFFRGFLITRMQRLLAGIPFAAVFAVLLPALFFGWAHMYYQGMRGFITTGAIAIAFGAMFLLLRKNLWPIVFVHGIVDTIGFVARYLDLDP